MNKTIVVLLSIGIIAAVITLSVAYAIRNSAASITARGQAAIDYAAASAIRSDVLMSWVLVAVLALVALVAFGIALAAGVALAWLAREHWRRDDGVIHKRPTVTR